MFQGYAQGRGFVAGGVVSRREDVPFRALNREDIDM
jgi:hypothetical protein